MLIMNFYRVAMFLHDVKKQMIVRTHVDFNLENMT